jgi:diketogulonate reductase-like aldo/keto reductase
VRDSGIEREDIYVTSKLPAEAKDYDTAVEEFETTMAEIGLDYLDLYLVHAPWPWDEVGKDCRDENRQIWKAMEEFLAGGRVRAIGVSNFDPDDLDSLLPACKTKPMVNQIRWFIGLDPSGTLDKCAEHDIVVEAYSPFAHGLIVNHPEIADIAARYDVGAPQLCIRFLLQKGAVVLPKATTTPHIEQNAEVDFEIPPTTWPTWVSATSARAQMVEYVDHKARQSLFEQLLQADPPHPPWHCREPAARYGRRG